MQRLEFSGAVRPTYESLDFKVLITIHTAFVFIDSNSSNLGKHAKLDIISYELFFLIITETVTSQNIDLTF
jgi:hypothetical protein